MLSICHTISEARVGPPIPKKRFEITFACMSWNIDSDIEDVKQPERAIIVPKPLQAHPRFMCWAADSAVSFHAKAQHEMPSEAIKRGGRDLKRLDSSSLQSASTRPF